MQVRPSNRPTCVQKADLVWVILSERQTSVKLRMAWLSSASRTSRALWSHPDRLEGLTPHACFFCCSLKLQFLRNLSSFLKSKHKRLLQSPLKALHWGFLNLIRLFISNFLLLWVKYTQEKNINASPSQFNETSHRPLFMLPHLQTAPFILLHIKSLRHSGFFFLCMKTFFFAKD